MTRNFFDLAYLRSGSPRQKEAFDIINASGVMDMLNVYTPVLVGTFPLDIVTETSDLDILCCFDNAEAFIEDLFLSLSNFEQFTIKRATLSGTASVVARFRFERLSFEIVGQYVPVNEQTAYRHMIVEWEVLNVKGEDFKKEIIALKKSGMKTEPAFASLLGLEGDPYVSLLSYKA